MIHFIKEITPDGWMTLIGSFIGVISALYISNIFYKKQSLEKTKITFLIIKKDFDLMIDGIEEARKYIYDPAFDHIRDLASYYDLNFGQFYNRIKTTIINHGIHSLIYSEIVNFIDCLNRIEKDFNIMQGNPPYEYISNEKISEESKKKIIDRIDRDIENMKNQYTLIKKKLCIDKIG